MPKIDNERLEAYAQMIYKRENQFTNSTLKKIAKRIKATGQLSAHDQEALKNIADISGDMKAITAELAKFTEMNVKDIEKIYAQVINDSVNTYKPLYDLKGMKFVPITENDHAMKLVRHWAGLTNEKMINLSHTKAIGFTDANGNFTDIQGAYQQTIDDAVIAVSNGTTDFNSAMKGTIEQLGGSGVVTNYGSGVVRSIEAMVCQNLLWGAKQAAQSYDDYVSEELGLDGFEVDAHAGCRPSHEFMQGKMYSYSGKKKIDGVTYEDGTEALAALSDYGCLHFKTGVLLGVSQPTYNQEELDRIHKETTELIEYDGKEKTLYEWKQTQRRLEREYRKAQTQSDMFKESGNNIAARDYRDRAQAIRATYDDVTSKVPGLYDHSERMRTYFKGTKPLTSGGSDGIINEREVEYGVPYGKHSLKANMSNINSDSYAKKFNITDNEAVNESLLKCARESIEHRTGTKFEDMYIINANTGEVMGFQNQMEVESCIYYNDSINEAIKKSRQEDIPIIAIHNHPEGLPPSIDDFNKAFDNNYLFGVACGHNEQVYVYKKPQVRIESAKDIHNEISWRHSQGMDVDRSYSEVYDLVDIKYEIIKGDRKNG